MNVDEYESLPTASVGVHMIAGAFAGVMEHCVMYPIDSVKTRMQAFTPGPGGRGGVREILSKMIRQEGPFRPLRGVGVMMAGAVPAHALYFSCYEFIKDKMIGPRSPVQFNHLIYGVAGCVATILHDGIMNPAEVIKQRLQLYNSPYRNMLSCMQHIYKTEGIFAFYRSYTTQLAMNVPFQSIHFIAYEIAQSITNPEHAYNPKAHMISGAMAGMVAAAITMPLDVCKTVLNTQQGGVRAQGMIDAFKMIYRFRGLRGYFRGLSARILYQMPATAICWSTYEFFKYALRRHNEAHSGTETEDGSCAVGPSQAPTAARPSSFQGAGLYFKGKTSGPVLLDVSRS
ncbi:mitoferrin-1 [Orussus abietinus]|uniref:mitoferrin-1 n=1 Tax=Orussus abietinus TaxID=222816 RepID=UPI000625475F|nr:mitoferrin-1 [Orussus abietinus]